mgnify:CR=1 FL=1
MIEYLYALQKHGIKLGLEAMQVLLAILIAHFASFILEEPTARGRRRRWLRPSFSMQADGSGSIPLLTSSNFGRGFVSTDA